MYYKWLDCAFYIPIIYAQSVWARLRNEVIKER